MKKQSASGAWAMLVMSLPKGIASFVIAVAGVCVSLPLILLWVGLPLLTATLAACQWMMGKEQQYVGAWIGEGHIQPQNSGQQRIAGWNGLRLLGDLLGQGRTYRGLTYSLAQLPVGVAGFTTAIVLTATTFACLVSPLAYKVSMSLFDFDLFESDSVLVLFFPDLTSYGRSWLACVIGVVLLILLPFLLRITGRWYASWVQLISKD